LFRFSTNNESCDCRNNIVWTTAAGNHLAMIDAAGTLHLTNNWLKSGWVASHSGLSGTISNDGGNLSGSNPGFADAANQDYDLIPQSPCVNAGAVLSAGADVVASQYLKHCLSMRRPSDGKLDLGAFELRKASAGGMPFLRLLLE
jgi:hypothetical protein